MSGKNGDNIANAAYSKASPRAEAGFQDEVKTSVAPTKSAARKSSYDTIKCMDAAPSGDYPFTAEQAQPISGSMFSTSIWSDRISERPTSVDDDMNFDGIPYSTGTQETWLTLSPRKPYNNGLDDAGFGVAFVTPQVTPRSSEIFPAQLSRPSGNTRALALAETSSDPEVMALCKRETRAMMEDLTEQLIPHGSISDVITPVSLDYAHQSGAALRQAYEARIEKERRLADQASDDYDFSKCSLESVNESASELLTKLQTFDSGGGRTLQESNSESWWKPQYVPGQHEPRCGGERLGLVLHKRWQADDALATRSVDMVQATATMHATLKELDSSTSNRSQGSTNAKSSLAESCFNKLPDESKAPADMAAELWAEVSSLSKNAHVSNESLSFPIMNLPARYAAEDVQLVPQPRGGDIAGKSDITECLNSLSASMVELANSSKERSERLTGWAPPPEEVGKLKLNDYGDAGLVHQSFPTSPGGYVWQGVGS